MATNVRLVQGKVIDQPSAEDKNVEALLAGFLHALLAEQQSDAPRAPQLKEQTETTLSAEVS